MKKYSHLWILALAAVTAAHAQTKKTVVYLDCDTEADDFVGQELCMDLRDALATSPRYITLRNALATSTPREISNGIRWRYGLHILSAPISDIDGNAGRSVQSVTFTEQVHGNEEMFQAQMVLITGKTRTKDQARAILAALDDQANQ